MGRPLSKQQFFGANEKLNIKVQFFNGTASVPGFIVKQTGSKRFLCEDTDGIQRACLLVDRDAGDLGYKQMTITVKYDNGDIGYVTKIARHRVTVDGTIQPWTFDPSTSDGYVQMEEAGDNDQLADNTDLEGDETSTLALYPEPGGGVLSGAVGLLDGESYNDLGAYEPGNSLTNTQTSSFKPGLKRKKYIGNFEAGAGADPIDWYYDFFSNNDVVPGSELNDTFVGFGNYDDLENELGGHNFSLEWRGWIQAPVEQPYNFYTYSDDDMAVWIGEEAISGFNGENIIAGGNALSSPSQTVTLRANKWYPIRIWFSEFNGGCQAQLVAIGENGGRYNSNAFGFKHKPAGETGWQD